MGRFSSRGLLATAGGLAGLTKGLASGAKDYAAFKSKEELQAQNAKMEESKARLAAKLSGGLAVEASNRAGDVRKETLEQRLREVDSTDVDAQGIRRSYNPEGQEIATSDTIFPVPGSEKDGGGNIADVMKAFNRLNAQIDKAEESGENIPDHTVALRDQLGTLLSKLLGTEPATSNGNKYKYLYEKTSQGQGTVEPTASEVKGRGATTRSGLPLPIQAERNYGFFEP